MAFFTDQGTPTTGLSATIDVWEHDGTHSVNAQSMTEIAGGWYFYDFTTYDESKDYAIRADGGAGLAATDRYVAASNEIGQVTEDLTLLKNIEGGKWQIISNQLIIYEDDNTTEVMRFNLFDKDGNASMEDVFKRERV